MNCNRIYLNIININKNNNNLMIEIVIQNLYTISYLFISYKIVKFCKVLYNSYFNINIQFNKTIYIIKQLIKRLY